MPFVSRNIHDYLLSAFEPVGVLTQEFDPMTVSASFAEPLFF